MTYEYNHFGIPTGLAKQFIGFDQMIDRLREASEALPKIPSYPPYNIKKVDEEHFIIEMAVAGFGKHNLDIEIKDDTLTISGSLDNDDKDYIYQGIANRAFTRKFTLADTVVVKNAELANGLLKIALERFIPEEKKAKKIDIFDPFGVGEATKQFLTEATAFQKQLAGEKTGKKVA
jgi:molecular chaperone IbpA